MRFKRTTSFVNFYLKIALNVQKIKNKDIEFLMFLPCFGVFECFR